ncbi:MAG: SIS domain-containing protein [Kiritimatiellae bacterium]|nr:SIS domain-containing protein [Kiritimatiellia bacterium]
MSIMKYYTEMHKLVAGIMATDGQAKNIPFPAAAERMIEMIVGCRSAGKKVIFIGNGGSAAIASHEALDSWKNAGIRAMAFNDAALLTCVSNDCGYEAVFAKPIEMFADHGDLLIAISSSGKSASIINGVKAAVDKGGRIITLSGFQLSNPLRKMGQLNLYVPSDSYGHVEIIHHSICHYVYDMIAERNKR